MSITFLMHGLVDFIAKYVGGNLIPIMVVAFIIGGVMRYLIHFTVRRQDWFAKEFEKRVDRFVDQSHAVKEPLSFFSTTQKVLERTFYEIFETRDRLKRRKPDRVMSLSDRVFLIKQGSAWLVKDILKQIKYVKFEAPHESKLLNITRSTFQSNPCFNRLLGIIPISAVNDVLSVLPGLFVICGIFGTFLGIMKGLPQLSGMNMEDMEQTKLVMDQFLVNIAFSMTASIVGIMFSVVMTVLNTIYSPDKLFVTMVDRFENSLDQLWNRCANNDVPHDFIEFDENKDPNELLASQAVLAELERSERTRDMDKLRTTTKTKSA